MIIIMIMVVIVVIRLLRGMLIVKIFSPYLFLMV